mmetsp:Transcript_74366/g.221872  ORF Transcript_74366/g.221872 Transcript_74366/m.221872 type:complete len:316 (-) Transcript_74366:360-1307(-)
MAARSEERTPMSVVACAPPLDRETVPTVGSKPLPVTSYFTPPDHMCTMVILPSVRVPVLSLQMTEAEPSVSTAASFRTSTFCFTMEELPMDSEIVTHRGMPSGMAATARVTAMRIMYSQDGLVGLSGSRVSMIRPMKKTTTHTPMAPMPMRAPNFSTLACSGVWFAEVSGRQPKRFLALAPPPMSAAILPMRVPMPVATTMPLPLPLVQLQLEKHIFSGVSFSASPPPMLCCLTLLFLETSSGSPVRHISATFTSVASTKRMSAGTTSPVSITTRSPRTTVVVSTLCSFPSRMTRIMGCDILAKASKAPPAWFSV